MTLDTTLLEILRHKATAAAEEMALTLMRTARTIYVKEVADFGTAIAGRDGRFFAYPEALGVAAFVAMDLGPVLRAVGRLEPGDVVLTNQPYLSGGLATHLPDLQFVRPYFHDGEILAYGWCFAHTSDIGGGVPSSISPRFSEMFQEGLQIPPIRLIRGGVMNQEALSIYLANCRAPELNMGDVKALLAALETGARRIADMAASHGAATVLAGQAQLAQYAAEKAAVVLRQLPEGSYSFWDYLDHDFTSNMPVRLRCTLTARDGRVHVDFAGTDPQVLSAYNLPTADIAHPYFSIRLMHLVTSRDPSAPLNHGLVAAVTSSAPKGSLLNPEFPAATGVRHATVMRLLDTVSGALAQADPGLVPTASGGTVLPVVVAEYDAASGLRRSMVIQSVICGAGARLGADGLDGRESALSNIQSAPTERTEDEAGVRVEEFALRPDSGGAGRWRGGLGLIYTIRFLNDDMAVLARGLERFLFRPWGSAGGRPGARCRVVLNRGCAHEQELRRVDMLEVRAGDTITFLTPGGGGFGSPLLRAAEQVLDDVENGFISARAALDDYGVVVTPVGLDAPATAVLRAARAGETAAAFDGGPERAAWESVFDDTLMTRLSTLLLRLPAPARSRRRTQIYAAVAPTLAVPRPVEMGEIITAPDEQRRRLADAVARLEAELT